MRWETVLSSAGLVGGTLSVPLSARNTNSTTPPCGLITPQVLNFFNDSSNAGSFFRFDPELANACLESSGIDNDLASTFVQELKKYIQFQSTLSYLKAPPPEYPYAPVDILGGLDDISSKAGSGGFSSQYAFDQALAQLITSAHEGHLYTALCTVSAIYYSRTVNFVSLSSDGVQLPLVYTLDDARANSDNFTVSNVVAINGQNVTVFIENEALYQLSDPDASYNAMFWNVAQAPSSGSSIGALTLLGTNFYPGPFTKLTFANGTQKSYANQAAISEDIWSRKIVDGDSFTYELCIAPAQSINNSSAASSAAPTISGTAVPSSTSMSLSSTSSAIPNSPTMLGHPETPIVKDPYNSVAGYFLNGTEYNDTAVLYVSSFLPNQNPSETSSFAAAFVNTTRDFFTAMKEANKTKLVIDLSGNGGGNVLLPRDLFRRLFPTIEPYGAGRLRISTAANIYGQTLGRLPQALFDPLVTDNYTITKTKGFINTSPWNYRSALRTDLENLTSWDEFFPPNVVNGDNFTIDVRDPTNNTYYDLIAGSIVPYGSASQPTDPQPFPAENIVVLTDGICASACSIFIEFMTHQAGVKTIVVGGRSRNAPMQAIGGTKGSRVYPFGELHAISSFILTSGFVPNSLLELAKETLPGLVNLSLGDPENTQRSSVNLQDNVLAGDNSQTPLQFIFEPADCRIFYNFMTVSHPHMLWEYAADVAWNARQCAWGGINANVTVDTSANVTVDTSANVTVDTSDRSSNSSRSSDASRRSAIVHIMIGMFLFAVIVQML